MSLSQIIARRTAEIMRAHQEAAREAARHVLETTRVRVAQNQDVRGQAFAPLSEDYARRVGYQRFNTRSLSAALRLRQRTGATYTVGVRSAPSRTGTSLVRVGTWHNAGVARRRGGRLPQREWFGLSETQRREALRLVREAVGRSLTVNAQTLTIRLGVGP